MVSSLFNPNATAIHFVSQVFTSANNTASVPSSPLASVFNHTAGPIGPVIPQSNHTVEPLPPVITGSLASGTESSATKHSTPLFNSTGLEFPTPLPFFSSLMEMARLVQ